MCMSMHSTSIMAASKGTPNKWLNIAELCRLSLPSHYQIHRIRYFTALVKPRPRQPQPGRAPANIYPCPCRPCPIAPYTTANFCKVTFACTFAKPLAKGPATALVVKTEEKGSDVNLATYLLVDAYEHDFEVAVVITNDSDLAEPINIVRRRLNHNVTVLSPRGQSRTLSRVATKFWQITVANLAGKPISANTDRRERHHHEAANLVRTLVRTVAIM